MPPDPTGHRPQASQTARAVPPYPASVLQVGSSVSLASLSVATALHERTHSLNSPLCPPPIRFPKATLPACLASLGAVHQLDRREMKKTDPWTRELLASHRCYTASITTTPPSYYLSHHNLPFRPERADRPTDRPSSIASRTIIALQLISFFRP